MAETMTGAERYPPCAATLVRIEPVARDTLVYTFDLEREMPFRAGQFFNLAVPTAKPRPERSYSVFSEPGNCNQLELCIKLLEGGAASEMLRVANIGDAHTFKGPYGVFTLANDVDPVTFIATGTGVAPYRAMLREQARLTTEARGAGTAPPPARRYRLYFGVRDEGDLFLIDELETLKTLLPDFAYTICLSRPSDAWMGFRGRVTAAVAADFPRPDGHFYLCGNGPMIEETKALLKSRDVDRKRIHFEKYY